MPGSEITIRNGAFICRIDVQKCCDDHSAKNPTFVPISLANWKKLMLTMAAAPQENQQAIADLRAELTAIQAEARERWKRAKDLALPDAIKRSKRAYERVTKMLRLFEDATAERK